MSDHDHGSMQHGDPSGMNHDDHSGMNHGGMDHGDMDHSAMMNATIMSNVTKMVVEGAKMAVDTLSDLVAKNPELNMDSQAAQHGVHNMHSGHEMKVGHNNMNMGDTTMDMGTMDMSGMDGMDMQMYFHFGYDEVILFDWWRISTIGGLIGSMVAIFLFAMLYEGMKYIREFLFKKSISSMNSSSSSSDNKISSSVRSPPMQMTMLSPGHFLQTLLHMVQFVISYCLMLIFMTYNVWLCLACTLGAGVGYFCLGWQKAVMVDVTEHCH